MTIRILIGLGNPGRQYENNRHNVGFTIIDQIIKTHSLPPLKQKFKGLFCEDTLFNKEVILFKPNTYMNLSGIAVQELLRFYKVPLNEVLVFHDDLDLAYEELRLKKGGGHGGHNGLRSLHATVGSDYWRVRFGIGHPGNKDLVSSYVLSDFNAPLKTIDVLTSYLETLLGEISCEQTHIREFNQHFLKKNNSKIHDKDIAH